MVGSIDALPKILLGGSVVGGAEGTEATLGVFDTEGDPVGYGEPLGATGPTDCSN